MTCQSLFSGKKNKKNISKCRLLQFLPRMHSAHTRIVVQAMLHISVVLNCKWLAGFLFIYLYFVVFCFFFSRSLLYNVFQGPCLQSSI